MPNEMGEEGDLNFVDVRYKIYEILIIDPPKKKEILIM